MREVAVAAQQGILRETTIISVLYRIAILLEGLIFSGLSNVDYFFNILIV